MSAADVWARVVQRQAQGVMAHAQMADALAEIGERSASVAQSRRALGETRAMLAARADFARRHGASLPVAAVQPPQLGDLGTAGACAAAWLAWETGTVAEYQRLYDEARAQDPGGAASVMALAAAAAREADSARAMVARLAG